MRLSVKPLSVKFKIHEFQLKLIADNYGECVNDKYRYDIIIVYIMVLKHVRLIHLLVLVSVRESFHIISWSNLDGTMLVLQLPILVNVGPTSMKLYHHYLLIH